MTMEYERNLIFHIPFSNEHYKIYMDKILQKSEAIEAIFTSFVKTVDRNVGIRIFPFCILRNTNKNANGFM